MVADPDQLVLILVSHLDARFDVHIRCMLVIFSPGTDMSLVQRA